MSILLLGLWKGKIKPNLMTKISRYNKMASDPKYKSHEIINALKLKKGHKVMEIGVGGGFYAEVFSKLVGVTGKYIGIDTKAELIENLEVISRSNPNIRGIKTEQNEVPLLSEKVDIIFSRNVYHHLSNRVEYFKSMSNLLCRGGRLIIIDYNESLSLMKLTGHYTKKNLIINEICKSGLSLVEDYGFLNKQSFLIFKK